MLALIISILHHSRYIGNIHTAIVGNHDGHDSIEHISIDDLLSVEGCIGLDE